MTPAMADTMSLRTGLIAGLGALIVVGGVLLGGVAEAQIVRPFGLRLPIRRT